MRWFAFVLIMGLSLLVSSACGGRSDPLPTLVPAIDPAPTGESVAPSETAEATLTPDTGLPPTWTPVPTPVAPATAEPPPPPATRQTYVVQPGDTLAEIAQQFDVPLDVLAAANDITDVDVIEVDQVLVIPER